MKYTFELLGVSPLLSFFNQQQNLAQQPSQGGVEYVANAKCTLDKFVNSVEEVSPSRGWDLDEVVETVIHYWMNNEESVRYWKERLEDAGTNNLLVARVGDVKGLQTTFELLLSS